MSFALFSVQVLGDPDSAAPAAVTGYCVPAPYQATAGAPESRYHGNPDGVR